MKWRIYIYFFIINFNFRERSVTISRFKDDADSNKFELYE